MTIARAILIEQRGANDFLVGRWPDMALIDPIILPEMCVLPPRRSGDDFVIELANATAQYRFVEKIDRGEMICAKIK
jgi:hypothetical protein